MKNVWNVVALAAVKPSGLYDCSVFPSASPKMWWSTCDYCWVGFNPEAASSVLLDLLLSALLVEMRRTF